ncbi:hypothetical protein M406DRAFT_69421 [Cryphonectria parasitica EP155]|uniref:F-box domain-containing protein n=1 Tax=Cryphonectria parasitica (strain ATCC 38755 / EP155) TaxID=660469 RepID=A0A9P4Y697_CRYP1|nr:uncharacterized protein M406DRAFT_69421 [Cryphonectria parasitica EP155]KAF3767260.1 hypothetical protein M406DRAFT_69421 [Cryphonectria parasitica EP155]
MDNISCPAQGGGNPPTTGILSLPDEILIEIFTLVKTYKPANRATHIGFASSAADIVSTRLVCRRFAAASAHLLVHYIRLEGIDAQSLEKLETISRHPLISKGVRIVRLEAVCYVHQLASNLNEFAGWAVRRVLERAQKYQRACERTLERAESGGYGYDQDVVLQRAKVAAVLERVKAVLKTWNLVSTGNARDLLWNLERFSDTSVSEEDRHRHIELLRAAHRRYQLRYSEQESLREGSNAFVERFTAAIARMPRMKALELQDFHHQEDIKYPDFEDVDQNVFVSPTTRDEEYDGLLDLDVVVKPLSWNQVLCQQLGMPPAQVLFNLPLAIHESGCKLDRICVRTTTPAEQYYRLLWETVEQNPVRLASAVSSMGIKDFAFIHGCGHGSRERKTPNTEDTAAFQRYIAAMTHSNSLERFRLAVDSGWVEGNLNSDHCFRLASLAMPCIDTTFGGPTRSWMNMKDMHLSDMPLRLTDLECLENILKGNGVRLQYLTLSRIKLVDGTWAQALEILRRLVVADKELLEPVGAECDDPAMSLSGRYNVVFGTRPGQESVAGHFINGRIENNPLVHGMNEDHPPQAEGEGLVEGKEAENVDITKGNMPE